MSRRKIEPSYRFHRRTGKAIVTYYDESGQRRSMLLPGPFNSKESLAEHSRVLAILKANGKPRPQIDSQSKPPALTVAELIERYWEHVQAYYRRGDGTETQEVAGMKYSLRPLNFLHGETLVKDFGPSALKAVRELLIRGYEHPKYGPQSPLCRSEINKRIKRIRRMVKWGIENEIVLGDVLVKLQAVAPLKRGRTQAKEAPGVTPVARAVVEDTLPILRPMIQDMVMLQLETGMRPGEVVGMQACDIDMSGPIWLYRPSQHKTLHHGHDRSIAVGPRAQEIIRRYLTPNLRAALFSPAAMMEERRAAMRKKRKSKVQPSQENRAKARSKRRPGSRYTVAAYDRAIAEAIKRHNEGNSENEHLPHWHPNQLRHLRALELKRQFGLDVARAVLGHRQPCITEHYAGVDVATAVEVMGKIG
jgi:integrase